MRTGYVRPGGWAPLAAVLVGAFGLVSAASANPVVFVTWSSTTGAGAVGGSSIDAAPGDTLMAEAFISTMPGQGANAYILTMEFDFDLGDELDLLGYVEDKSFGGLLGDIVGEVATESDGATVGSVTGFDDFAIASLFGTFRIAKFTFEVTGNVTSDGDDVRMGLVQPSDLVDNVGTDLSGLTTFLGASVNVVPEPGTVGLLALGLLGLAAAARCNGR